MQVELEKASLSRSSDRRLMKFNGGTGTGAVPGSCLIDRFVVFMFVSETCLVIAQTLKI